MSFILDALKKSESDRQRQSGPSLFEVKVAPPRRTLPVWAVAIAVLLVINVVVISWMLLRHPAAQQPRQTQQGQQPAPPGNAPAAAPPTSAMLSPAGSGGAVPTSAADRASAEPTASAARAPSTAAPPAAAPVLRAESSSQPAPATPAASGDDQSASQAADGRDASDYAPAVEPAGTHGSEAAAGDADDLPLYQQIVTSDGLPALHLDLHVFADHPQDRFVMINMHRLREGDSLPGGVQVDAIRPDGVVLTYRGTRFLLPRN